MNNLALSRGRFAKMSDADREFCLRQIDGRQRAEKKLPEIAAKEWWLYPARLSMEQCSSEATAKYKQQIVRQTGAKVLVDLTGGAGIDCYYMSEAVEEAHYVERNADLCRIAEHNLHSEGRDITVHHADAEAFIAEMDEEGREERLVYADPARRSASGGKVFRIEDCEPNVAKLLPQLLVRANHIIIKLSPMLDLSAALKSLGGGWQMRVVAAGGEVKEVLAIKSPMVEKEADVVCEDLKEGITFSFDLAEERECKCQICSEIKQYLYEPNGAIIKAGAYKLAGARYGLEKLADNTHLYTSPELIEDYPGRVFRVLQDEKPQRGQKWHVMTRNYPLRAEELAKKLHVSEGGEKFVIGARVGGKAVIIAAAREKCLSSTWKCNVDEVKKCR